MFFIFEEQINSAYFHFPIFHQIFILENDPINVAHNFRIELEIIQIIRIIDKNDEKCRTKSQIFVVHSAGVERRHCRLIIVIAEILGIFTKENGE